jgi:hypothetical protein
MESARSSSGSSVPEEPKRKSPEGISNRPRSLRRPCIVGSRAILRWRIQNAGREGHGWSKTVDLKRWRPSTTRSTPKWRPWSRHSVMVENVAFAESSLMEKREDRRGRRRGIASPIVTAMGHAHHARRRPGRHSKDATRRGEAGGITHIGATTSNARDDHVRRYAGPQARRWHQGAQVTDLVILVVAADDGIMPRRSKPSITPGRRRSP